MLEDCIVCKELDVILNLNRFVFPVDETFVYSQDRRAKKNAPATSWHIASSRAVALDSQRVRKTRTGSAFCGFSAGSSVVYALYYRLKVKRG